MPVPEKKERNLKMYLQKMGYENVDQHEPTKKPLTYRELEHIYNISYGAIIKIIKRYRAKYAKK